MRLTVTNTDEIRWLLARDDFEDELLAAWEQLCAVLRTWDPQRSAQVVAAADSMRAALKTQFLNVPEIFP